MGWLLTGWRLSRLDLRPVIIRKVGTGTSDSRSCLAEPEHCFVFTMFHDSKRMIMDEPLDIL